MTETTPDDIEVLEGLYIVASKTAAYDGKHVYNLIHSALCEGNPRWWDRRCDDLWRCGIAAGHAGRQALALRHAIDALKDRTT